jgi:hypothetical protein
LALITSEKHGVPIVRVPSTAEIFTQ